MSTIPPAGPTIRQFDPAADVLRLLRFFNALEALEGDPHPSTEAHVRSQMAWRGHDPARDRWVIVHPQHPHDIIGHAWIFTQTTQRAAAKVAVHPQWQRQGLGSRLVTHVLTRAQQMGVAEIVGGCDSGDEAARGFLQHHGFAARSSNWFMQLPPDVPVAAPIWPPGYTVQPYAEQPDPARLADTLNRCYHDIPGHAENEPGVVTADTVTAMLGDTIDPEQLYLVQTPDGKPAAVCRLRLHGRCGNHSGVDILDAPGVVPAQRHRDLYTPLAQMVMQVQRQISARPLTLESYGDDEHTVNRYRALGFVLQRRFVEYARRLTR